MTALRPAERLLLLYFAYSVVIALSAGDDWRTSALVAGAIAITILGAATLPSRHLGDRLRDWLPVPLILAAYWQMNWIRGSGDPATFARSWLPLDRWLLARVQPNARWDVAIDGILESAYLLTYAIPLASVVILYLRHNRDRIDRFYTVFFSGTLAAYALLPYFPSASPRFVDPGGWQPAMTSVRHVNIWLLDHADIRTSVFPSGHVAAAFSAAFGMFTALPERKRIAGGMLVLALLIAAATVYGRYHYAVDVLASVAITVIAWLLSAKPRTLVAAAVAALSFMVSRTAVANETLSPSEQTAIARAFAPVLVFHRDEDFFPLNSSDGIAGAGDLEGVRDRVAKYVALPLSDRLVRAAVGYRVFSRVERGRETVVVEYWCHYLYNAYTVRVGWLPYRVRDNHPEDLERLYLVLTPEMEQDAAPRDEAWALRSFRIRLVVANAHDGSVPPNQYNADIGAPITLPLTILVERGSHAMAPDINHDGRFTPSIDSTAPGKLLWGIRDGGNAWGWYRSSYMDRRDHTAVRLCADPAGTTDRCAPYALYPVTDLQRWFDGLQLSNRERLDIVGHTSWVTRVFGDVRVENLMVPADPPDGHVLDRMLTRRTRTQAGYEAGFTMTGTTPAGIAGKRFFWDVPSQRMPDIVADVSAIVPPGKPTRLQGLMTGSYALDATTNVLVGAGWFSAGGSHADGVLGFDVRVGRFHVQPLYRLGHDWLHANLIALF